MKLNVFGKGLTSDGKQRKQASEERQERVKLWCENTRKVLKISRKKKLAKISYQGKESTVASKELKALTKELMELLKDDGKGEFDSERAGLEEQLETLFADFGPRIVKSGEGALAQALALKLGCLRDEARARFSAKGPVDEDSVLDERAASEKNADAQCQSLARAALDKAARELEELKKYDDRLHVFSGNFAAMLDDAKQRFEWNDFLGTLALATDLAEVGKSAHASHADYRKCREEFDSTGEQLAAVRSTDPNDSHGLLAIAQPILQQAQETFLETKYPETLKQLSQLKKAIQDLLSTLPPEENDTHKAIAAARSNFAKAVESWLKDRHELAVMRGVDALAQQGALRVADSLVELAQSKVDQATDAESIKKQTKRLEDELKNCIDEFKKLSKGEKSTAKDDVKTKKSWEKHLAIAQDELKILDESPGANVARDKLRTMITNARSKLHTDGMSTTGYKDALACLDGHKQLYKEGLEAHAQAQAETLPPVFREPIVAINGELRRLSELATTFVFTEQQAAFRELLGSLALQQRQTEEPKRTNDEGRAALGAHLRAVNALCEELQDAMAQAEAAEAEAKASLERLTAEGIPAQVFAPEQRRFNETQDEEMSNNEWEQALAEFTTVTERAELLRDQYQRYGKQWNEAETVLKEIDSEKTRSLLAWVPLATLANSLLGDARALMAKRQVTNDLGACLDQFRQLKLKERLDEILARAALLPNDDEQKLIEAALQQADADVFKGEQALQAGPLKDIMRQLKKKVLMPSDNPFRRQVEDLCNEWQAFSTSGFYKSFEKDEQGRVKADSALAAIAQAKQRILDEFGEIKAKVKETLADSAEREKLTQQCRDSQSKKLTLASLDGVIAELEQFGVDCGQTRKGLAALDTSHPNHLLALQTVEQDLERQLLTLREKREQAHEAVLKEVSETENKLKDVRRHADYKPYREELARRLDDIRALLDSDDLYLAEQGKQALEEVKKSIADLTKSNREPGLPGYGDVEKLIKRSSKLLGKGVVRKYSPTAYARLNDELQDSIVEARASSPTDALKVIEAVHGKIVALVQDTGDLREQVLKADERANALKERWKEFKSEMNVKDVDALDQYFSSRFDEAKAACRLENGVPQAEALMDAVESQLTDLSSSTDGKGRAREMDEGCAKDQRYIRDLAREFEVELEIARREASPPHWYELGEQLGALKQALEEASDTPTDLKATSPKSWFQKIGQTLGRLSDHSAELQAQSEAYQKLIDQAAAVVAPYIRVLSFKKRVPFMSSGEPAPRVDKAKLDFQRARGMLADVRISVSNMLEAVSSTDVGDGGSDRIGNLRKLHRDWILQVSRARNVLNELSSEIIQAGETVEIEAPQDADVENLRRELTVAAKSASRVLEKLARRFQKDAFDEPLRVLMDKKADEADRKAAREAALRVMRALRTLILKNPAFEVLCSSRNPFNPKRVVSALADVRVGLKRIELSALTGV